MKRFFYYIFKFFTKLFSFLIFLFLAFIIYLYIISYTNGTSIEDSYLYVQSLGKDIISLVFNVDFENTSKDQINVSTTPVTISNNIYRYYYDQLDDNAKIMYSALENNIDGLKEINYNIDFSTQFNDLLNEASGKYSLNKSFQSALDAFAYDHPELFYIDLSKISLVINYTSFASKTIYKVSFQPEDNISYLSDNFNSKEQVEQSINEVEKIKSEIISSLDANSSDYEKALSVHDSLVRLLEYDSKVVNPNTRNIYGALVEKSVVCEGYAKSYKYILDSLGIKCILVSGSATNSSNKTDEHMWNYINIDGNWYGVDITWDDPIIIGTSKRNIIRHDYFCKRASTFNQSHTVNGKISDSGLLFSVPNLCATNYK